MYVLGALSRGLSGAGGGVWEKGTNGRYGGEEGITGAMVSERCIEKGLMVRADRDSLGRSPPLTISHQEIDEMFRIIEEALDEVEPALRARERASAPA